MHPPGNIASGRAAWLVPALLVAAVVGVFGGCLAGGFVNWDDPLHVTDNPGLNPVTTRGLADLLTRPYRGLFAPVSYAVFAVETVVGRWIVGDAAAPPPAWLFHATSLLLHAACTVLVWRILCAVVRSAGAAAGGAAVFAVHPLQVESVAWISEQRGLLAAMLSLVAIDRTIAAIARRASRFSVADEESPSPTGRGRGEGAGASRGEPQSTLTRPAAGLSQRERHDGRRSRDGANGARENFALGADDDREWWPPPTATIAFLLALLAKPSAVVVPLVVAAIARERFRVPWPRIARGILPWVAAAAVCAIGTKLLQPVEASTAPDLAGRLVVAGDAMWFYAEKLFAPLGLCIDYGRTPSAVLADPWSPARAVVAWILVAAAVAKRPFARARLPVVVWLLGLAPVLGLVPFAFQGISTVADRYAYLAMLGPAIGVAMAVAARRGSGAPVVVAAVVTLLSLLSWRQVTTWRDSLAVNGRAVAVNGGTRDTLNNLGMALLDAGDAGAAASAFRGSVARAPDFAAAHFNLGCAVQALGETEEARRAYEDAIRLRPGYAKAHNNLGILLASEGRFDEARVQFRLSLAADPGNRDAAANLRRLSPRERDENGGRRGEEP